MPLSDSEEGLRALAALGRTQTAQQAGASPVWGSIRTLIDCDISAALTYALVPDTADVLTATLPVFANTPSGTVFFVKKLGLGTLTIAVNPVDTATVYFDNTLGGPTVIVVNEIGVVIAHSGDPLIGWVSLSSYSPFDTTYNQKVVSNVDADVTTALTLVHTDTQNVTLTLPTPVDGVAKGYTVTVKKLDAAHTITIQPAVLPGDTIDMSLTPITLTTLNSAITLVCCGLLDPLNGGNWMRVASYTP